MARTTITPPIIRDMRGLIITDIMNAPATINGDLKNSLRNMLTAFCTAFTSLVILVIRVDAPRLLYLLLSILITLLLRSFLISAATPVAALAAKYWAVTADMAPTTANANITRIILTM